MRIRVVVADDHPMYRLGLTSVLAQADDVEVVAEATDGDQLLAAIAEHHPDVVLTDLTMPGTDGLAAMTRLLGTGGPPVLVLTMHTDDESVFAALRAGARGYLVKGADSAEILRAVRAVAAGDAVYGAAVAHRILDLHSRPSAAPAGVPFPELTPRERDVLGALASGARNHQIAQRLGLSEKTVRNHVSAILLKLQVPDRTAAAIRARDAGVTGP